METYAHLRGSVYQSQDKQIGSAGLWASQGISLLSHNHSSCTAKGMRPYMWHRLQLDRSKGKPLPPPAMVVI